MFKENRIISISSRLIEFWCFGLPVGLGVGGGWLGVGGGWLGCPPHMCTCTRTRGKHDNFMQMAAPLGEYLGIPYDVIRTCMRMCACTCVCMWVACTLLPPPNHPPTPRPQGGSLESVKIQ